MTDKQPAPATASHEADLPESPTELPLCYLVSQVVFPFGATPVRIRMERNLTLLDALPTRDTLFAIAFAPSIDPAKVTKKDLGTIGVLARVIARLKLPDGSEQVTVQGLQRMRLDHVIKEDPYFVARVTPLRPAVSDPRKTEAELQHILAMLDELAKLEPSLQPEHLALLRSNLDDPGHVADLIANVLNIDPAARLRVLEIVDIEKRLTFVASLVNEQLEFARVVRETDLKVRDDIEKSQREYYLRRQMKILKEQLGETTREEEAAREAEQRLATMKLPPVAEQAARKEIDRLRGTNPQSAEFAVIENYLDWLLSLPWDKSCGVDIDVEAVRKRLDLDHFGLEQPKQRILEYLAVRKLAPEARGPVLCLVGPPGTGKTSLAQSVARAMGRTFARIALGGVRDESEIRGHRRTYVGAMPGRIIAGLKRAGCNNPLFVIDEVDKLGAGPQGDPAAALLEVLDPEQNHSFTDHFLDVPVDLSQVFFVATANNLFEIPDALRDRMEVIELSSYVEQEKVEIARRHLVKKAVKASGIGRRVHLTTDSIRLLVRRYTMEAGVRDLARQIDSVYRKLALRTTQGKRAPARVGPELVTELLGPPPIAEERRRRRHEVGVVNGLAWTGAGGDVLTIECLRMPGEGALQLTGSLGDVMRESAQTAYSFVKSRFAALGTDPAEFKKWDVHLHFPEGAVPKDGPSAGVAVVTCFASVFSGLPVRADVAMTGEVTLRGEVLAIGGLREKLAAAARLGIPEVIIPKVNAGDLHWVRKSVLARLKIHLVSHADEVLEIALRLPVHRVRNLRGRQPRARARREAASPRK